jgi:hypothetical protein
LSFDDSPLHWNPTSDRLGINTASPDGTLHVVAPSGSFFQALTVEGSMTSNLISMLRNTNAGSSANALWQIAVAAAAAGDPFVQFQVQGAGGSTASIGLDNSDSDKMKFKGAASPSNTPNNMGMTLTLQNPSRLGINNDDPQYDLDVNNFARAKTHINTNLPPSISVGPGMGTVPTGMATLGGQNGFFYTFTTGSSPTTNGVIFTVTPQTPFPAYIVAVFSPQNVATANDIQKFYISTSGNTSFQVSANGTLSASTTYALFFILMGY